LEISIDASSWINLSNAAALDTVLQIPEHEFLFSPLVASECHAACVVKIIELSQTCAVVRITDQQVDANLFLDLIATHELGDGETECLAICIARPDAVFCCDDRKARQVAEALLGADRVIGSLRLLKWAVEAALISSGDAFVLYTAMKAAGGFLPHIAPDWFDA
jgi:predicted nucleic acid-binding protein